MVRDLEVLIAGALGKMGRETIKAIKAADGLHLNGAVDVRAQNNTIAEITRDADDTAPIMNDLEEALDLWKPDTVIDFTNPQAVLSNSRIALKKKCNCVIGTTGLDERELAELDQLARDNGKAILVIPNFSIGAILMMRFAQQAAQYFPNVEIIEFHHDGKMDAPSGTAIKTAEMINEQRSSLTSPSIGQFEKYPGARGGQVDSIRVHSVRLPGYIAHQEVLFGSQGQALTIRHDTFDRECFMPGVILAVKKAPELRGLVYGLEHLL
ncbi:MAG: 4-hydroxy-tetrahydrodipicolinate reductase [Syntrophomonadaceae bacterium]|nr:4-hydroxy-tetrahydrodipicolinate reductase [Syntrophomonadaceae bacterium]